MVRKTSFKVEDSNLEVRKEADRAIKKIEDC
jgi:hypothetical protein